MNQTPWGNEEKTSEVRKGHRPGGKTLERLESTPPHAPRPPCTGVMMSSRDLPPEKRGEKKQSHAREDFETQRGEKKKKREAETRELEGRGKVGHPHSPWLFLLFPFSVEDASKTKEKSLQGSNHTLDYFGFSIRSWYANVYCRIHVITSLWI